MRLGRSSDDPHDAVDASGVPVVTATLEFDDGEAVTRGGGDDPGDWRASARAEAAVAAKTFAVRVPANGPPRRNSSFTEGSSRDRGGWTSYNPATGPR